jgi:hypothetical protein
VERFAFCEKARKSFAVVQTLERRPYANVILQKGAIGPDGREFKPERMPSGKLKQETTDPQTIWVFGKSKKKKEEVEDWI